jgi:hypothetical protein
VLGHNPPEIAYWERGGCGKPGVAPAPATRVGQLHGALACLRHALYDPLGIQFRLALPPLVVASQ